jgi:hypothetical protein
MREKHILDGKVHVYKRPNSSLWQCSSYFAGKNRRTSTKEESLSKAKEIAEDWYLQLRGKLRAGEIKSEKTFREVSEQCLREYDTIMQGQRNTQYVNGQRWRSSVHLVPFFANLGISEITAGRIQEYRIHRHQQAIAERGKPPGHSTMHQQIVMLRQTPKTALRHGWLDRLPDFSEPYRSSPKISHRAWFSPEEYKRLYEATRKRAQVPEEKGLPMGIGTTSRLGALRSQYRTSARTGWRVRSAAFMYPRARRGCSCSGAKPTCFSYVRRYR